MAASGCGGPVSPENAIEKWPGDPKTLQGIWFQTRVQTNATIDSYDSDVAIPLDSSKEALWFTGNSVMDCTRKAKYTECLYILRNTPDAQSVENAGITILWDTTLSFSRDFTHDDYPVSWKENKVGTFKRMEGDFNRAGWPDLRTDSIVIAMLKGRWYLSEMFVNASSAALLDTSWDSASAQGFLEFRGDSLFATWMRAGSAEKTSAEFSVHNLKIEENNFRFHWFQKTDGIGISGESPAQVFEFDPREFRVTAYDLCSWKRPYPCGGDEYRFRRLE